MGKSANLSEEAYAVLQANKRSRKEGLSQVILRVVPKPIRTFGDLERHLERLDDTVFDQIDIEALRRVAETQSVAVLTDTTFWLAGTARNWGMRRITNDGRFDDVAGCRVIHY